MEETYTVNDILAALPWETMFKTAKVKKAGCVPEEKHASFWGGYSAGVIDTWHSIDENIIDSKSELDIDAGIIAGFKTLDSYLQEFEQALGIMTAGDDPSNLNTNYWDGAVVGSAEVMQLVFELKKNWGTELEGTV